MIKIGLHWTSKPATKYTGHAFFCKASDKTMQKNLTPKISENKDKVSLIEANKLTGKIRKDSID